MRAYRVSQLIDSLVDNSDSRLADAESALANTRHQQMALQQQIASVYSQLAVLLLQESPEVGETDAVQAQIDHLKQEITSAEQHSARCEAQIISQHQVLQELNERIEPLEQLRDDEIARQPDILQAEQQMRHSADTASQRRQQHDALMAETREKLEQYQQQKIFSFLLNRHYGQPDYRRWLLVRRLDGWLAQLCHFTANKASYRMLQSLQRESTRLTQADEAQAATHHAAWQKRVAKIEKRLGLPALYRQRNEQQKKLDALHQKAGQYRQALNQLSRGEGESFNRIVDRLSRVMAKLPLERLTLLADKTATPQDDVLLVQLRELLSQQPALNARLVQDQQQVNQAQKRSDAASLLQQQFSRRGYDDPDVEYSWGLFSHPEELFVSYLMGKRDLNSVFRKLDDIARAVPKPAPVRSSRSHSSRSGSSFSFPSSSGSSAPRSSSSSGGGFSTTSSTGGSGGFRTTDSF